MMMRLGMTSRKISTSLGDVFSLSCCNEISIAE